MRPMRVVVVGYGPVGARLVDDLLPGLRAGTIELTVVGGEPADAYNRVLISEYAVGAADRESMTIADRAGAEAAGARIVTGAHVSAIDRAESRVVLDTGEPIAYDRLVLATGSRANIPTLEGVPRPRRDLASLAITGSRLIGRDDPLPAGVRVLRDLDDAETVAEHVRAGRRIVVLGAGVLGLEFALAAARAGADVTVIHHGGHPMPRNLDRGAGTVLTYALRQTGVRVVGHSRAEAVVFRRGADGERVFDALITADGKQIVGDLLVLSCGVTPRTELATLAGLRTSTGVLVDEHLRSWSDDAISAIGDCAHVVGRAPGSDVSVPTGAPSGLIGPGWRQASWLAVRLMAEATGTPAPEPAPRERDSLVMLKAHGVDVVARGDVSPDPWDIVVDDGDRVCVAQWADPEHGRYVKLVTRAGVLEAFACVGMPRTAAELTLLAERGSELPADRSVLLRFDGPDDLPQDRADAFAPSSTVCWCNGVTVEGITDSARCGNSTIEAVGAHTRAGTGCGGCKGRIGELLVRLADPDSAPALAAR